MSKDIINQTIGKNIRYFRKLKGLTLLELADQLGLSEGTVQRYESGNITNVSISIAVEFAKVLNTTPQIFDWNKHMIEVAIFYAVWGFVLGRMKK